MLSHPSESANGETFLVPTGWGHKATTEERGVVHLQTAAALAGDVIPAATDAKDVNSTACAYAAGIIADVIAAARATGMDIQSVIAEAIEIEESSR